MYLRAPNPCGGVFVVLEYLRLKYVPVITLGHLSSATEQ